MNRENTKVLMADSVQGSNLFNKLYISVWCWIVLGHFYFMTLLLCWIVFVTLNSMLNCVEFSPNCDSLPPLLIATVPIIRQVSQCLLCVKFTNKWVLKTSKHKLLIRNIAWNAISAICIELKLDTKPRIGKC